jgi:hypothetical protein
MKKDFRGKIIRKFSRECGLVSSLFLTVILSSATMSHLVTGGRNLGRFWLSV